MGQTVRIGGYTVQPRRGLGRRWGWYQALLGQLCSKLHESKLLRALHRFALRNFSPRPTVSLLDRLFRTARQFHFCEDEALGVYVN